MTHYIMWIGMQRENTPKCFEMTGTNKKVVTSRAGAESRNKRITWEVDERAQ